MTAQTRKIARSVYRALPFKKPMFELIRRGPRLPHSVYQHLHFKGTFTVRVDKDHHFRIKSYGEEVENDLFWAGYGGNWEAVSLCVWAALCRGRRGLILDIGANTGVYALAGSAASDGGRVIAFEPLERVSRRLMDNIALNGFPITAVQKAVSDQSGSLPIYDTMSPQNYSASLEGQGPLAQRYEVEVTSLDDYLASVGGPEIGPIKIDVERHEPAVLRGMKRTLSSLPPMLIEVLTEDIGREVAAAVGGLRYAFYRIDEARGLIPANDLAPTTHESRNYLICTPEDFERSRLAQFVAP